MKMKQVLLGTLFAMGTLTYAQGNQVIKPMGNGTTATATMNIEVSGQVFDKTAKSMVVEIKSAASPDGTGFAFKMPELFANGEAKTLPGEFLVYVQQNGEIVAMGGVPNVKLVKGGNPDTTQTTTNENGLAGGATGATIKYDVSGKNNTNNTQYNGIISVNVVPGAVAGTYSDTSVSLTVEGTAAK